MSGSDSGRDSPITSYMDDAVVGPGNFEVLPDSKVKRKIQHVDEVMMILRQSYDPQRLAAAMKRFIEDAEDGIKLEYMEENLAHLSILEVMRHLASHTDIQQIGFQILCKFLSKSTLLRENLQHSEAYKHVLRVICEHISDVKIQTLGMQILALLVTSEHLRMQILLDEKLAEVMDVITVAITGFRENSLIQTYAIMALNHLLTDDCAQQESFMSVELNFVMDSLT
ncbi:uncharacterized protein LOC135469857 [Liolophura sinensis]|uniref:uncharacterized protein LOC135469857 n=1 Tax=Liolophura sinensis TaxID=3198878 RepID=UPI003159248D